MHTASPSIGSTSLFSFRVRGGETFFLAGGVWIFITFYRADIVGQWVKSSPVMPTSLTGSSLATPLPVQLLADVSGKAVQDAPSASAPVSA